MTTSMRRTLLVLEWTTTTWPISLARIPPDLRPATQCSDSGTRPPQLRAPHIVRSAPLGDTGGRLYFDATGQAWFESQQVLAIEQIGTGVGPFDAAAANESWANPSSKLGLGFFGRSRSSKPAELRPYTQEPGRVWYHPPVRALRRSDIGQARQPGAGVDRGLPGSECDRRFVFRCGRWCGGDHGGGMQPQAVPQPHRRCTMKRRHLKPGQTMAVLLTPGAKSQTPQMNRRCNSLFSSSKPKAVLRLVTSRLAGQNHPVTGIPFDADGYPDFSGVATKTVEIRQAGNYTTDFADANAAAGLAETPKGYTWHHHQNGTTMQLVPTSIHRATGHTGGVASGGG